MLLWSVGVSLWSLALAVWIAKGRRWAFGALSGFLLIWIASVAVVAGIRSDYWLSLFVVALSGYAYLLLNSFWKETRKSHSDPLIRWYQGEPRSIPNLICRWSHSGSMEDFRVARFDRDGAFVFHDARPENLATTKVQPQKFKSSQKMKLKFSFEDHSIDCSAEPVAISPSNHGVGVRFSSQDAADLKRVGDLFEAMKGRGYAE